MGPRDGCPKLPRALPALWGTSETSRQRAWAGSRSVSHVLPSARVPQGEPLCPTLSALWLSPSPLHPAAAHPAGTSDRASLTSCLPCPKGCLFPFHSPVSIAAVAPGDVRTNSAPAAMNLHGCASDLLLHSPWGAILTVPTLSADLVLLGQT